MEKRGISFRSILLHSLWTTLTGILFFTLATTKDHKFGYIKFFSISGTLLITLPWLIQLLMVTSAVIILYKIIGFNLMWIIWSPTSEENHLTNVKGDTDEIEISIVIGADGPKSPKDRSYAHHLVIEGRNNTKLLKNGSPVA
ncbi:hypothetical protein EUTSA_v10010946mg [Eutrema salsugineum]|uniref:Uncharacterized protein n=1 Tax=Eutrema salsugineum TaxID=72664 RepID=V4M108_EUTSA|nr:hypothetical protein EUTSA_v10010946mg [Eutrema salsugineum]